MPSSSFISSSASFHLIGVVVSSAPVVVPRLIVRRFRLLLLVAPCFCFPHPLSSSDRPCRRSALVPSLVSFVVPSRPSYRPNPVGSFLLPVSRHGGRGVFPFRRLIAGGVSKQRAGGQEAGWRGGRSKQI